MSCPTHLKPAVRIAKPPPDRASSSIPGEDLSGPARPDGGSASSAGSPKSRALGALFSDLAAVTVYFAVEGALRSVTASLAMAGTLPALWTLAAWRRWGRLDYLGLASVFLFVIAIAISVVTGGSALPLKLSKAGLTGIIGLVALASAALRRPIIGPIVEVVSSRRRGPLGSPGDPARRRRDLIATVIVGLTALLDATAQFVLASTMSTGSFLVVGSIVRWTILAIGGATMVRYLRRHKPHDHN